MSLFISSWKRSLFISSQPADYGDTKVRRPALLCQVCFCVLLSSGESDILELNGKSLCSYLAGKGVR
jgi:hypothetical protein